MFSKDKEPKQPSLPAATAKTPERQTWDSECLVGWHKMKSLRADCERKILEAVGNFEQATGLQTFEIRFSSAFGQPNPRRSDEKVIEHKINEVSVLAYLP